jgi:predicted metal-dependent hydrolase
VRPDPEVLFLETASGKIPLHIVRGKGRRLRLTVLSDGRVRMSVPQRADSGQVLAFAREKAGWIARAVEKVGRYTRLHGAETAAETGLITVLGQVYPVRIEEGRGRRAVFAEGVLRVPVADPVDAEAVRRRIEAWLKRRAEQFFAMVLERALKENAIRGLTGPASWTVRRMKRRWGSCGHDGKVVFNVRLVQTPPALVEYVVLHELAHLKHHHHGKTFYALLGRCLPDWKERRQALNAIAID